MMTQKTELSKNGQPLAKVKPARHQIHTAMPMVDKVIGRSKALRRAIETLDDDRQDYLKRSAKAFLAARMKKANSMIVLIVSCAFAFIVLNGPAFAQFKPSVNLSADRQEDPATEAHRKEIENEYKSKLKTIPNQEPKKSDPWGNLRSAEPSKK
jgi:hypothetical protein